MRNFFDIPIDELLNTPPPKEEKKEKTVEEMMENIIRADMEMMLKVGRDKPSIDFPDPVEPRWKN